MVIAFVSAIGEDVDGVASCANDRGLAETPLRRIRRRLTGAWRLCRRAAGVGTDSVIPIVVVHVAIGVGVAVFEALGDNPEVLLLEAGRRNFRGRVEAKEADWA